jgi:hypothetical protein
VQLLFEGTAEYMFTYSYSLTVVCDLRNMEQLDCAF